MLIVDLTFVCLFTFAVTFKPVCATDFAVGGDWIGVVDIKCTCTY